MFAFEILLFTSRPPEEEFKMWFFVNPKNDPGRLYLQSSATRAFYLTETVVYDLFSDFGEILFNYFQNKYSNTYIQKMVTPNVYLKT